MRKGLRVLLKSKKKVATAAFFFARVSYRQKKVGVPADLVSRINL
jgi:hypothetical protein